MAQTFSPSKSASVNMIFTLYLETSPAYIESIGFGVFSPSSTHVDFLVNSIFKSHTKFTVIFLHAGGVKWPYANNSKVMPI